MQATAGITPIEDHAAGQMVDEQRRSDARVLTEALESGHHITIEGGTPDARAKVSHAIRNALQVLTTAGVAIDGSKIVAYEDVDLASVERSLATALEADACREATTAGIQVYDEISVQQLVDEIDEKPHRFATRFIAAIERVRQLEERIERTEEKQLLVARTANRVGGIY